MRVTKYHCYITEDKGIITVIREKFTLINPGPYEPAEVAETRLS